MYFNYSIQVTDRAIGNVNMAINHFNSHYMIVYGSFIAKHATDFHFILDFSWNNFPLKDWRSRM